MGKTIRIEEAILRRLKAIARREKVSLARILNRTLRAGLQSGSRLPRKRSVYREQVHSLGIPRLGLDKASALAGSMNDEAGVRELAQ